MEGEPLNQEHQLIQGVVSEEERVPLKQGPLWILRESGYSGAPCPQRPTRGPDPGLAIDFGITQLPPRLPYPYW